MAKIHKNSNQLGIQQFMKKLLQNIEQAKFTNENQMLDFSGIHEKIAKLTNF